MTAALEQRLLAELERIPLIDAHTHINPHRPAAQTLDDLLGYHYYTELAHSAGLAHEAVAAGAEPQERVRAVMRQAAHFENTVQWSWFEAIARTFLGFTGERVTAADADGLWSAAASKMS